jgi:hypothetical protein
VCGDPLTGGKTRRDAQQRDNALRAQRTDGEGQERRRVDAAGKRNTHPSLSLKRRRQGVHAGLILDELNVVHAPHLSWVTDRSKRPFWVEDPRAVDATPDV